MTCHSDPFWMTTEADRMSSPSASFFVHTTFGWRSSIPEPRNKSEKSSCELDETTVSNIVFCMIISYYAVIFVIQTHFWMTVWGDWIVESNRLVFFWYALKRRRSRFFRFGKPRKFAQKRKSRRMPLKCSTIDFRGTHVVCIGVPSKSRQNAIFWTPTGIPESGVPSTSHLPKEIIPEGDQPAKPRDSWKTRTDTGHRASMNRKSA